MPLQVAELTSVVAHAGEVHMTSAWANRVAPAPHAGSQEAAAEEGVGGDSEARTLHAACVREVDRLVQDVLSGMGEVEGVAGLEELRQVLAWLAERADARAIAVRRRPSRRGSAIIVDRAVRQQRNERAGSVVEDATEVEELRREGLLAPQNSASAPRARRDGDGYAIEPTENVVYLVPELQRLVVADEPTAYDWLQRTWLRRAVFELLFRPGAYIFFLLGVLIPAWGPFALAHMVGRPLSSVEVVQSIPCGPGANLTWNGTWQTGVQLLANSTQAAANEHLNESDCAGGLRTVV